MQTHEWSCLPPLPVLRPGATRVPSALLCYTVSVPTSSNAVMLLQGEAVPEQEASLRRMDVAEECVGSLNGHDYRNRM